MNKETYKLRIYFTGVIILIISVIFIIRLFNLHYSTKITISNNKNPTIRRGYIKDSDGEILALSIVRHSLYANPSRIKNPIPTAKILSKILNIDKKSLLKKLTKKKRFVWIKRKLLKKTYLTIKSFHLKGINFKKEYLRIYPENKIAGNIIGFVGRNNKGLDGIEYRYNNILNNPTNNQPQNNIKKFDRGCNINLTIKKYIQYVAEKELEKGSKLHGAKNGVAIVYEIKTGKILALAKYPRINPNYYYKYTPIERSNFSIVNSFEPGSTLKIIFTASLLKNNRNQLNKKYFCNGKIEVEGNIINCTENHGHETFPDIIHHSCNVGIVEATKGLKSIELYRTLKRFRFGRNTNSGIPGEAHGILRPVAKWSGLSKYSIAIGHEISVTSLQMVAAFGTIGNHGIYMNPQIIESIIDADGNIIKNFFPTSRGKIINSNNAKILLKLMRGVVTIGTGKKAASKNYQVVGKTGTSRKFSISRKRYSKRLISSFIGLAPFSSPKICVFVVLDEPEDKGSGGDVAAPIFSKIIDQVLPFLGVSPTERKIKGLLKKRKSIPKIKTDKMPNFLGKDLSQSLEIIQKLYRRRQISYTIKGTGNVIKQIPLPGINLTKGKRIILYFK